MQWRATEAGYTLFGADYRAVFRTDPVPNVEISFDSKLLCTLPLFGAVNRDGLKEECSHFTITFPDACEICLEAKSNLWEKHAIHWRFEKSRVHMRHEIEGSGRLDRVYFASSGESGIFSLGDSNGFFTNSQFYTGGYFSPAVNLANRHEFDMGEPNTVGLTQGDFTMDGKFMPVCSNDLFVPPLCYVAHTDSACMGIGIGTKPGSYRFNEFVYSGILYGGASFYVDFLGYTAYPDHPLPELFLNFGYDPYAVLQSYVQAIDEAGFSTQFTHAHPAWHYEPIVCGWSSQTAAASLVHGHARDFCTQENYETWLKILDDRNIPYGTIVIDDKWMEHYGTFTVDPVKWPDMKGFIKRMHEKGHHVLLWAPVLFTDGVPDAWCIHRKDGTPLKANLEAEEYKALLEKNISYLIKELDVDGFKEDLINCGMTEKNLPHYGKYHGMELLAAFQRLLYETAHSIKPDALIETQTPNPFMRETSDMLRLNDLWYGAHNVPEIMRTRARIARIAGWELVDCDDGGASGLKEWADYVQAQPAIGIPALYFVNETEATHEKPSPEQWETLRQLWEKYRRSAVPKE